MSIQVLLEARPCNDQEDADELTSTGSAHVKRGKFPSPSLSGSDPNDPHISQVFQKTSSHSNRGRAAKRRHQKEQGGQLQAEGSLPLENQEAQDIMMDELAAPSPTPSVESDISPEKLQSRSNKGRAAKRQQETNQGSNLRSQALENHVFTSKHISVSVDTTNFKYPSANFLSKYRAKPMSLEDIKELNFQIVPWDGKSSGALCDTQDRIITILAGEPNDSSGYFSATEQSYQTLKWEGQLNSEVTLEPEVHCQGRYYNITCGISHGNGTKAPINFQVSANSKPTLHRLLNDNNVQRMAGHASASLRYWAPEIWQWYSKALEMITTENKNLEKPFSGSVFACSTFKFGPQVWTHIHWDSQNVPYGFCAIHALGNFDSKKGGHLVLWDLKVAIEFPPGSLILIPSALLYHSNIHIQEGEERASLTHFYPAGLLQYAESGMQTDKSACDGLDQQEKKDFLSQLKAERLERELQCMPLWHL